MMTDNPFQIRVKTNNRNQEYELHPNQARKTWPEHIIFPTEHKYDIKKVGKLRKALDHAGSFP
jgi:hypothetical protein